MSLLVISPSTLPCEACLLKVMIIKATITLCQKIRWKCNKKYPEIVKTPSNEQDQTSQTFSTEQTPPNE